MIPVSEPLLNGNEKKYLIECIETGWISSEGPFVKKFEEMFANYLGVKHAIAVCNGTAALEVAMFAIDLKPGDEVIMPTFTIISCAFAILRHGGLPVLVDVEPDTWCMNVEQVKDKITLKTKAIMAVHMYGHPVDMDPIMKLAEKYGLYVIEDAAQVHGAEYKGKKCGSIGHVNCFSFYANKIITTGEGGMVVTNDDRLAERARLYRNLCFKEGRRFYHEELGANYRMTNLQAAVGVAQMERIEEFVEIKRKNAMLYNKLLADIEGLQLPVEKEWAKNVYWMYGVVLDEKTGLNAEEFANKLKEKGVATRPFFLGMHEQPVFQKMGLFKGEHYPVAERIARQGLYLPSGLTLTEEQIEKVVKAVKEVLEGK
ncbi:MAG: perosamine synthetase [Clostridia bacterium]|nr:perosamine synthetase [Rikenellaceae bacterium]MDK2986754.1 perosamine synthetase [Clostridia bacterium]